MILLHFSMKLHRKSGNRRRQAFTFIPAVCLTAPDTCPKEKEPARPSNRAGSENTALFRYTVFPGA